MRSNTLAAYVAQVRYKGISLVWQFTERSMADVHLKIAELLRDDPQLEPTGGPGDPPLTIEVRRIP